MFEHAGRMLSLDQIYKLVETLAGRIAAPIDLFPQMGSSADWGRPHVEVDEQYHWVIVERGSELDRRTTADLNELMYWSFLSMTFSMASDYELRNRNPNEDPRRGLFGRQLQLLSILSDEWSKRREVELMEILAVHPFVGTKAKIRTSE